MSSINIAVVGAGLIGRKHIEIIQDRRDINLTGIIDPSPVANELAQRLRVPYYPSISSFFAHAKLGATGIIIATPNELHAENALECISRGIPILIEKPISNTLKDALRISFESERSQTPVLIGHHRRHNANLIEAQNFIRDGSLGSLVSVLGSAMYFKPATYFEEAPWRKRVGGGPILINMIHEIDNLRALCGDVRSVHAFASNSTRRFEVEDTVAATLEFQNGALGTFMLSDVSASTRSWEHTSNENPDYPHTPAESCYTIAGTRGSIDIPNLLAKSYPEVPSWWEKMSVKQLGVKRVEPLKDQLSHFVDVISQGSLPLVTPRDAVTTLATTLAVAQSAKTGHVINVDDLLAEAEQGIKDLTT